jgi:hypothetical protein
MMGTLDAETCQETLIDNNKESAVVGTFYVYTAKCTVVTIHTEWLFIEKCSKHTHTLCGQNTVFVCIVSTVLTFLQYITWC